MSYPAANIAGNHYHRLTAVRFYERRGEFDYWLFKCDCGEEAIYRKNNVTSTKGKTKSCGCLNLENTRQKGLNNRTHGMSTSNFYYVWKTMINRCKNPSVKSYPNYGGRGIRVLWESFEEFRDDMYQSYVEHLEKYGSDTSI